MEKWVEYNGYIYQINGADALRLRLESCCFGLYKEVLHGHSGIFEFGAHSGALDIHELQYFAGNYEFKYWSEDKIKKRLRYSTNDGGTKGETLIESIKDYFKFRRRK